MQWTAHQEEAWRLLVAWSERDVPGAKRLVLWGRAGSGKTRLVEQLAKHAHRRLVWYYPDASQDDIRGWKNSNEALLWTMDADEAGAKDMAVILRHASSWSRVKPVWIIFQSCRRPPEDLPKTWTCIRVNEQDMRTRDGIMDPVIHTDADWHACAEAMGVARMDDEFEYMPSVPFPGPSEWWNSHTWEDASLCDILIRRTSRHDARMACMAAACIYHQHVLVHKLI